MLAVPRLDQSLLSLGIDSELTDTPEAADVRARFDLVAGRLDAERMQGFATWVAEVGLAARIEELADVLAAGAPAASLQLIALIAAEAPTESLTGGPLQMESLVYWAGVSARLRRPEFGRALAEMDRLLGEDEAEAGLEWDATDEGSLCLESLGTALAPLAGLDVAATLDYANVYVANFPPFGLPLGDVDQRAARWLAQLLDTGDVRTTLRKILAELADTWEDIHPRGAAQVRNWAGAPVPSDPTRDAPWLRAMLTLARTQV